MKKILILSIFYLSIILTAYSQNVISLNSLYTEQDAVLIPEIVGYWKMPVFDWTFSVENAGDNFYHFKYQAENSELVYEALLVKIEDELFLDLRGILPDTLGVYDYRETFLPCHSIYKMRMTDDTLFLSSLSYSWFFNDAVKKKMPLRYEWINNAMLLTFSTDEFKSFLAENSLEDGIFNEPDTLIYESEHFIAEPITAPDNSGARPKISFSQKCFPKFPFKDGWLGGDGDVSVPINDSTVLFIFSDTYVGNRKQESRQETDMMMVSNSLAIQTCLYNGKTRMQYFWNNMYTDYPEPFFKSKTNRYKFWVVDAYTIKGNLYVLLEKVGPKPGASPDDIFNFSGLGFTLAKISNPYALPPEWKIKLFPLPDFESSFLDIRCHARQEGFMYFFVSRNDTSQFLIRKQIDFFDNPEIPFEYYALDKIWKQGWRHKSRVDLPATLWYRFHWSPLYQGGRHNELGNY